MRAKKVWILVIFVLVAIFGGRVWYLNQNKTDETNTIKIGLLTFDTGLYAEFGKALDNGARMAVNEFNNSNNNYKLELFIEDGKGQAKDALNAFNRLNSRDLQVMIIAGENQVPPVAPRIQNTPAILTSVTTLSFLEHNMNKMMYLVNPSAKNVGNAMGKFAKDKLNLKNVAILSLNAAYGQESAEGFILGFGMQPVVWEKFKDTSLSARDQIIKILAQNPDGVYVVGHGPAYPNAFKQLKEQRYNGIVMSDYTVMDEDIPDSNGIYFSAMDDEENSKKLQEFSSMYHNIYNEMPTEHSKLGYDAVRVIVEAVNNSGKTRQEIQRGLSLIKNMPTFFGKMEMNSDGTAVFPLVIKQVQPDGTAKIVKE